MDSKKYSLQEIQPLTILSLKRYTEMTMKLKKKYSESVQGQVRLIKGMQDENSPS